MRTALVIYISVLLVACSPGEPERPSDILTKNEFTALLEKMFLIEGHFTGQVMIDDQNQKKFRKEYLDLFTSAGTDSAEVRRTFDYYSANREEMKEILRTVSQRLAVQ